MTSMEDAAAVRSEEQEPAGRSRRGLLADLRPLQESRDFRRLWIGQSLSAVGTMMTGVVVAMQMYSLTHSSLAVGGVGLAEAVPVIAFGLFGGSFADTTDRRKLVLVTTWLTMAVSLLFAGQAVLGLEQVWLLYLLAAFQAGLFAVNVPATRTFMPRLLPPERITAGAALSQLSFQFSLVVGPLLAGGVTALTGAGVAYLLDAASFCFLLVAVVRLPPMTAQEEGSSPGLAGVTGGVRYVRRRPVLSGILLLDISSTVFGMPMALFPAIAAERFGSESSAGLLYAAPAVGGVVAGVLSGPLSRIDRQGRAGLVAVVVWGLSIAAFAGTGMLWLAMLLLAGAGAADMASGVFRSAILQLGTPDALRGRVNALGFVVGEAGPNLGHVRAGLVAQLTSPAISAATGGLACVAGAVLTAVAAPALVRYRDRTAAATDPGVAAE